MNHSDLNGCHLRLYEDGVTVLDVKVPLPEGYHWRPPTGESLVHITTEGDVITVRSYPASPDDEETP